MKCPHCGKDMVQGYLRGMSEGGIDWVPKYADPGYAFLGRGHTEDGSSVVLDRLRLTGRPAPRGTGTWVCKSCNLFLARLE